LRASKGLHPEGVPELPFPLGGISPAMVKDLQAKLNGASTAAAGSLIPLPGHCHARHHWLIT
jgi:hypothetical protein